MDIRILEWDKLGPTEKKKILERSGEDVRASLSYVQDIIDAVKAKGDEALYDYTLRFDKVDLRPRGLRVGAKEFDEAEASLPEALKDAIRFAIANVERFHERQLESGVGLAELSPGVWAGERSTPVDSAGLYVPRAKGSFPSMLYMMAVPARLAGVGRVVFTSPPDSQGDVDPACLYAARLCGIQEVYRLGGPFGIAALALGTESVRPVVKLLGPGNRYVTAAKFLLGSVVDTGLPAGPSESVILCDGSSDPRAVALDLLVEAEHGPDSSALLVTPDRAFASRVAAEIGPLLAALPEPRQGWVRTVLGADAGAGYGGIVLTRDLKSAVELVNEIATEHLQIRTREPWAVLSSIRNAGEIILGENTPFSAANYCTGANAVLPTGGKARTWSGVSVRDFTKRSSVIFCTEEGRKNIEPSVLALADYEGFPAHAGAFRNRR